MLLTYILGRNVGTKEQALKNRKGYRVWVALLLGNVGGNHTVTKVLFGECEDCVRVHAHRCAHMAQLLIKLALMDDSLRCTPVGRDTKSWASAASAGGELGHAPISLLANEAEDFEMPVLLKHIPVHSQRVATKRVLEQEVLAFRRRQRRKITQTSQDLAQYTGSASAAQSVTDPSFTACSSAATVSKVSAKLLDSALQSKKDSEVLPPKRKGDLRLGARLVKKAKQARRKKSQVAAAEGNREDVKSYRHQLRSGGIPLTKAELIALDVRRYASFDQAIADKIALRRGIEASLGYIVAAGPRGDGYTPPKNSDREALWLRGFKGAISGLHSVNAEKKKQQPPPQYITGRGSPKHSLRAAFFCAISRNNSSSGAHFISTSCRIISNLRCITIIVQCTERQRRQPHGSFYTRHDNEAACERFLGSRGRFYCVVRRGPCLGSHSATHAESNRQNGSRRR